MPVPDRILERYWRLPECPVNSRNEAEHPHDAGMTWDQTDRVASFSSASRRGRPGLASPPQADLGPRSGGKGRAQTVGREVDRSETRGGHVLRLFLGIDRCSATIRMMARIASLNIARWGRPEGGRSRP